MKTETPEEKAKRLGVEYIPTMPFIPQKPTHSNYHITEETKRMMAEKIIAVCGCGKEIKYFEKRPCGNLTCPFGYEHY